jgi:hypothetical protein
MANKMQANPKRIPKLPKKIKINHYVEVIAVRV